MGDRALPRNPGVLSGCFGPQVTAERAHGSLGTVAEVSGEPRRDQGALRFDLGQSGIDTCPKGVEGVGHTREDLRAQVARDIDFFPAGDLHGDECIDVTLALGAPTSHGVEDDVDEWDEPQADEGQRDDPERPGVR